MEWDNSQQTSFQYNFGFFVLFDVFCTARIRFSYRLRLATRNSRGTK